MKNLLRKHVLPLLLAAALTLAPASAASAASPSATPTIDPSASVSPTTVTPSPTPTAAPTVNPGYEEMVVRLGDQGPVVELLQQRLRDLGFYNYKITDYYGSVTELAVKDFQEAAGVTVDGEFGGQTAAILYSPGAPRQLHNKRIPTPTPKPTPKPTAKPTYGTMVEWSTAKGFVAWGGGPKFQAIDFRTGKSYYLIRVGGTNHMDVEPATLADTNTLKACYGGVWSYDRRPTIVKFGGKWYAASINGFPHGKETVSGNGMNGQICLHFLNSRTHGTNLIDAAHQRCIRTAAGK